MKTLLTMLLLGCFMALKAQTNFLPGYLITHDNDTLHGLIDYRSDARNARRCDFRENEHAPVREYLPGSIKSYRFDNSKYYVSRSVPVKGSNEPVFLEFLVNGISDLFYYSDGKYHHFYIEKEDGKMYELTNELQEVRINDRNYRKHSRKYIGILKVAFADSPELFPLIDHSKLDHKSLITISRKYHDYVCDGEQCVVYEKKVPSISISLGAAVAANSSSIRFPDDQLYQHFSFQSAVFPTLEILMNTTMPRVSEKLSLELSVEAGKAYFYGTENTNSARSFEEAHLHTWLMKRKVGIKYTWPKGKIRPTILAGGHYAKFYQQEGRRIEESVIPFNDSFKVTTGEDNDVPTTDRLVGYQIDCGIDFHQIKAFTPFVRLGYESTIGSKKYTWHTTTKINTIKLNAGIYF